MAKNSGKLQLDFSEGGDKKTRIIIAAIILVILAAVGGTLYSLIGDDEGGAWGGGGKGIVTRWYACRNPECGRDRENPERERPPWQWSIKVPESTPHDQDADGKPLVCPKCGTGKPFVLRKCPNPECNEAYPEDPEAPLAKCPLCGADVTK